MVEFKILCGKILAGVRWARSTEWGGAVLIAALLVTAAGGEGESPPAAAGPGPGPERLEGDMESAPEGDFAAGAALPAADTQADSDAPGGRHPEHLLLLPNSAPSALVFDLADYRMHLFAQAPDAGPTEATASDGESPAAKPGHAMAVGDTFVAVGKQGLYNSREGDEKTPLGIYFITSYIPGDELPAIYGVGALPLDYPNTWDRRRGRTGSGIWIHGTDKDEESLLPQSSRGCLTLRNGDFETMSELAEIRRTPVIVSAKVDWVDPSSVVADRDSLSAAIEAWRRDWESLETDRYLSHYSRDFRTDSMNLSSWSSHKRRVNANKAFIRVGVQDLGLYAYPGEPGLFLVTFTQTYESSNFRAQRWKQQYWRREAGNWRIVHEGGS